MSRAANSDRREGCKHMSDESQGPGWWQASDDQWYSPESHPNYRPPPPIPQAVPSVEAVGGTEGPPKGPTHPQHKQGWWGEHGFPFSLRPLPIVTGIVVALMAIGGIAFATSGSSGRSEEHTSELQSRQY